MKKILIAEDDPDSREVTRINLQAWGYEVVEACDGREALEKINETSPDLVLLDIQMPFLDGFAVLRQLRQDSRFAALPVAAVTAYAMRGDKEKALEAGFCTYITKPIDATALQKAIEQILKERAEP